MADDRSDAVLARIAATLEERKGADPATSYAAALFAKGGDAILLLVEQHGGIACHTGRERCFYKRLDGDAWREVEPVLRDPKVIYGD